MPTSVVLVIGMHRSGTSLTTAVLQGLGAALSEDLVEHNEFNANGYFESRAVMELHDRILATLGSSWRTPITSKPFPPQWWNSAEIEPLKSELKRLVYYETQRTVGIWAVKDPRASRLLPLWNAVLDELHLDSKYLLSVRDPAEVARSLEHRDGIGSDLSDLLWLEHNAAPFAHEPERIKAVLRYRDWLEDPVRQAQVLIRELSLPELAVDTLRERLKRTVMTELRHHNQSRNSNIPYVDDLHRILTKGSASTIALDVRPILAAHDFAVKAAQVRDDEQIRSDITNGPTIYEITQRLAWREDVSERDVSAFIDSENTDSRTVARVALARTSLRRALAASAKAAESYRYADAATMNEVRGLIPLVDVDTPYIEVLKQDALRAVSEGRLDHAIAAIGEAFRRAFATGMRAGSTAKTAFSYLSDREMGQACEAIGRNFSIPEQRGSERTKRVAILYSDATDSSTADRAIERARCFAAAGYAVSRISTAEAGIAEIVERFSAEPVDAVLFMPHAQDVVARIVGCIDVAPVQFWENRLIVPACGRYDAIVGPDAGIADRYLALPEELDAAQPLSRTDIDIPEGAVVIATVGRIEKCAHRKYLDLLSRVLEDNERAWIALAGSDSLSAAPLVNASFDAAVRNRVRFFENDQWRHVLKMSDIYCDTAPWHGERGVLAATRIGIPVVASASDSFEYRALMTAYCNDEHVRRRAGRALQERERLHFDAATATNRLIAIIEKV